MVRPHKLPGDLVRPCYYGLGLWSSSTRTKSTGKLPIDSIAVVVASTIAENDEGGGGQGECLLVVNNANEVGWIMAEYVKSVEP